MGNILLFISNIKIFAGRFKAHNNQFFYYYFSHHMPFSRALFFLPKHPWFGYIIWTRFSLYNMKLYDHVVIWSTHEDLDDELHGIGSDYIIKINFSQFGLYNSKFVKYPIKSQQLVGKMVISDYIIRIVSAQRQTMSNCFGLHMHLAL